MTELKPPKRLRDWAGYIIRTTTEMRNGYFTAPAGSVLEVIEWKVGRGMVARLKDPCECCGLRGHISGIQPHDVQIVAMPGEIPAART